MYQHEDDLQTVRPAFGERKVRARELYRTRVLVLKERLLFLAGSRALDGSVLAKDRTLSDGTVFVPYWNGRSLPPGRSRPMHLAYRDITAAIRGQGYAHDGYHRRGGEVERVSLSRDAAKDVIRLFLRYGQLSDDERTALRRELSELTRIGIRAFNVLKVKAGRQLGHAAEERDSRGRPNPGARSARVASAVHLHTVRIGQIRAISQVVDSRRLALISEDERMWSDGWVPCYRELERVVQTLNDVSILPGEPFKRDCVYDLNQAFLALETIDVQPYLSARDRVQSEILSARGHIRRGRYPEAHEDVNRALQGIRLKRAGRELHRILFAYSLSTAKGRVNAAELDQIANDITVFLEKFVLITEHLLRRPVKEKVLAQLNDARALITSRPALWARDVKQLIRSSYYAL